MGLFDFIKKPRGKQKTNDIQGLNDNAPEEFTFEDLEYEMNNTETPTLPQSDQSLENGRKAMVESWPTFDRIMSTQGPDSQEIYTISREYEKMRAEQEQVKYEKEKGDAFAEWCKSQGIIVTECPQEVYEQFSTEYDRSKGDGTKEGATMTEGSAPESDDDLLLL